MPQPPQLFLEKQVFSRSYSSFLEELSVWYFVPPSDAKDALQTANVKRLEGLEVGIGWGSGITLPGLARATQQLCPDLPAVPSNRFVSIATAPDSPALLSNHFASIAPAAT